MLPLQQAYEVKEAIYEFIQTTYRFKDQDVHKAFKEFIEDYNQVLVHSRLKDTLDIELSDKFEFDEGV